MRRRALIGAMVAIAGAILLAIGIGPDLLEACRFEKTLDSESQASRANGGPWPQLQDVCSACHGAKGRSQNRNYASLAGQPANYLVAQLHAFAKSERSNPQMSPLAAGLSDRQIAMLAQYFARQAALANEPVNADAVLEQHGRSALQSGNCAACHGAGLMGNAQAPRLAGQGETYLFDQLAAFKNGVRRDPTGAMNQVTASLSESDAAAVAHDLAAMKPTATGKGS